MKKVLLILFLATNLAVAQKVKHHSYTTYYNAAKMEPDSVSWVLSPEMLTCGHKDRVDKFSADPLIANCAKPSDYAGSGYDQGHLFSWDDA